MIAYAHLAAPWAKVSLQKETLLVVFYLIPDASDLVRRLIYFLKRKNKLRKVRALIK